jgi:cytochrome c oxidase cbb3-type subunit IV
VDFASTLHFAQTTGLAYFFAIFAGVLVYALRPKAKQKFDRAARMPLDEE